MSGIRYLIDDLDCLESCNSIPMTHANAGGMAAIELILDIVYFKY